MADIVTLPPPEAAQKPRFCRTPTAADIEAVLSKCHTLGRMGVVVGNPGIGKTTAAQHYAATADGRVWVVPVTAVHTKVTEFLKRVVEGIGAWTPHKTAPALYKAILRHVGREGLLVIDEAQELEDKAIKQLRFLNDEAGIGVVLMGNVGLVDRWTGSVAKEREWAQLTSRIDDLLILGGPTEEDLDALCRHHGIAGRAPQKLLADQLRMPGGLRGVARLIELAGALAQSAPIETRHIEQAIELRGTRL